MKLKEIYNLIDGICIIFIKNEAEFANFGLPEPTEEILNKQVKSIEPFYWKQGLYKYGVIIRLKGKNM